METALLEEITVSAVEPGKSTDEETEADSYREATEDSHHGFIQKYETLDAFHISSPVLDGRDFLNVTDGALAGVVLDTPLNKCRRINKLFGTANEKMLFSGRLILSLTTTAQRKRRILSTYPIVLNYLVFAVDFIVHRVLPKLVLTKRLYFSLTRGRTRVISLAESLGRLISCGFEIQTVAEFENTTCVMAAKVKAPVFDSRPTYGPLLRMPRVGREGKMITVYKIRTMHPFSEFLQEYVLRQNGLETGGKFKHDFRVTGWGRFLRKTWLDELPMIANWLKGDLKLVGVRPITEHYLSLYPEALIVKRRLTKPGLIPPYYADLPESFEEIIASEDGYLEAYSRAPFITDVRYFMRALTNIVFRGARSK